MVIQWSLWPFEKFIIAGYFMLSMAMHIVISVLDYLLINKLSFDFTPIIPATIKSLRSNRFKIKNCNEKFSNKFLIFIPFV